MSKIHQWFVARGRLAISTESVKTILELDPEGSAYCVLSVQDSEEIAGIVESEARSIWDSSGGESSRPAQVDGDVNVSCKLVTESGVLQVMVHDSKPFVALSFEPGSVCRMNVAQAIALIQILRRMITTTEARRQ